MEGDMRTLKQEIFFYFFQLKKNVDNQQALRGSFWMQVVAMFLNNIAFFVIWVMFSQAIGVVNGWGPVQTFGMLGVSMMTFGIVHSFFGGLGELSEIVPNGKFDAYLTKPKILYVRTLNNNFIPTALGDLIQGLLALVIFCILVDVSWGDIALLILMIPPACVAQLSFMMICDVLVFWLPHIPMFGLALRDLIILPSTQPISLLRGALRILYLTAIPALLVAGLPIEIVTHHHYEMLLVAYVVSLCWLALSIYVFNGAVRRYESGNVIG
jgi:ABC-type uncharacterized transport system permease subunit